MVFVLIAVWHSLIKPVEQIMLLSDIGFIRAGVCISSSSHNQRVLFSWDFNPPDLSKLSLKMIVESTSSWALCCFLVGRGSVCWPEQWWESLWGSREMGLIIKGKSKWASGRWVRNSLSVPSLPMWEADPWSSKLSFFCSTLDCRDRYFINWIRGKEGKVFALPGNQKISFVLW